ncbi:MFS transporter [Salibacterium sp. K-3]
MWKELIGLVVFGMAFAEGSANDWVPLAMVDGFNVQPIPGIAMFTLFLTAMFLGRTAGGFFLDRFGRVPVFRTASLLAFSGLALVIFTGYLPVEVMGLLHAFVFVLVGIFLAGMASSSVRKRLEEVLPTFTELLYYISAMPAVSYFS